MTKDTQESWNDPIRLDGKVAIITGGAGGIGEATARLMSRRGARVAIADIAFDAANALADQLPNCLAVKVDLSNEGSVEDMVRKTVAHFGRMDILHNNAALLGPETAENDGNVENMPTDLWDRTFTVNARGTMIACRASLPHLRKQGGAIINTVSNLALQGHIIQSAYSASKAALIQLTRSIAASHGRYGIRCNAIAPGMTKTPSLMEAFPPPLRELMESETPTGTLGVPEDIAQGAAFLASDAAKNISGQVLVSDGGFASHVAGMPGFRAFMEEEG